MPMPPGTVRNAAKDTPERLTLHRGQIRTAGILCPAMALFLTFRRTDMAVNKPISDNARKGAVREHPQLDTEINSGMPGRRTP